MLQSEYLSGQKNSYHLDKSSSLPNRGEDRRNQRPEAPHEFLGKKVFGVAEEAG